MKYLAILLLGVLIFAAGCTDSDGDIIIFPETEQVESPVMILPDIPGVTYSLTAVPSPTESGNLEMKLIVTASNTLRKSGYDLQYTFFVYNTDAFEEGWYPKTYEEAVSSGIVYTTKRDTLFPSNTRTITVVLPREASVQTLDLSKPYVYGIIGKDVTI